MYKKINSCNVILFGNLMDVGKELEDDNYPPPLCLLVGETHGRWIPEYKRFQTVFPTVEGTRAVTTIPGNHDVGLGDGITPSRLNRFKHHFTEHNTTSQILETCNFELILL